MKNLLFHPKAVELIVDWQQVDSITNPDLRLFFMEAKNCLADFFPSMKEDSVPADTSYTEVGDLFSKEIPLYLPELLSADIVFQYLYDLGHYGAMRYLMMRRLFYPNTNLILSEPTGWSGYKKRMQIGLSRYC